MNISQSVALSNPEILTDKERVELLLNIQGHFYDFIKDNGGKKEIQKDMGLLQQYNHLRNLSNVAKLGMLINKEVIDDEFLIF